MVAKKSSRRASNEGKHFSDRVDLIDSQAGHLWDVFQQNGLKNIIQYRKLSGDHCFSHTAGTDDSSKVFATKRNEMLIQGRIAG